MLSFSFDYDVYSFSEYLTNGKNTYDQFCINYINEKVQHFFIKRMIKEEEQWYEDENLNEEKIPYLDNSDVLGKCV